MRVGEPPLGGAKARRTEGDDCDGVTGPVSRSCHEDEAAPPVMAVPRKKVIVRLRGRAGFP